MHKRLQRLAATIALTATAATGYALADLPIAAPAGDSTWGAPDTTTPTTDDSDDSGSGDSGTDRVAPRDSTWG
jgi:hypothetical protein